MTQKLIFPVCFQLCLIILLFTIPSDPEEVINRKQGKVTTAESITANHYTRGHGEHFHIATLLKKQIYIKIYK